jgi:hypothetical protein
MHWSRVGRLAKLEPSIALLLDLVTDFAIARAAADIRERAAGGGAVCVLFDLDPPGVAQREQRLLEVGVDIVGPLLLRVLLSLE